MACWSGHPLARHVASPVPLGLCHPPCSASLMPCQRPSRCGAPCSTARSTACANRQPPQPPLHMPPLRGRPEQCLALRLGTSSCTCPPGCLMWSTTASSSGWTDGWKTCLGWVASAGGGPATTGRGSDLCLPLRVPPRCCRRIVGTYMRHALRICPLATTREHALLSAALCGPARCLCAAPGLFRIQPLLPRAVQVKPDLSVLVGALAKPLRCLWVSQVGGSMHSSQGGHCCLMQPQTCCTLAWWWCVWVCVCVGGGVGCVWGGGGGATHLPDQVVPFEFPANGAWPVSVSTTSKQQPACLPCPMQDTHLWAEEGQAVDVASLPFTPVVLVNASASATRERRCLMLPAGDHWRRHLCNTSWLGACWWR